VPSTARRNVLWGLALVVALVVVGVTFVQGGGDDADEAAAPESPSPRVPDDPGDGCGDAAATDPADLAVDRTLARCGPGAPEPRPLPRAASVRVAVTDRSEAAAPLLLADERGELDDEKIDVEIVDMAARDAYAAMAAGDVDVVVGQIDAPFFDAVHDGLGARLVLGGPVASAPSDTGATQAGLWVRADLISEDEKWDNVRGQAVRLAGGLGSSAVYPVQTTLSMHELDANLVSLEPAPSREAAEGLQAADVGAAWLSEPVPASVGDDPALRLVATLPGSESIDGTVFSPRLLGPDREVGLAYVRAVVRTINTHLADGYDDEVVPALAEALDVGDSDLTSGPPLLFDWELRAGTTTRIQRALVLVGGVGYEETIGEGDLVDRSLAADVVAEG
jgi:NitT/TauT family transport system substrate-binding protein